MVPRASGLRSLYRHHRHLPMDRFFHRGTCAGFQPLGALYQGFALEPVGQADDQLHVLGGGNPQINFIPLNGKGYLDDSARRVGYGAPGPGKTAGNGGDFHRRPEGGQRLDAQDAAGQEIGRCRAPGVAVGCG